MTGSSWGYTLRRLTADEIDANARQRVGSPSGYPRCSSARCPATPTHEATYRYVTGRKGRTTDRRQEFCDVHAAVFGDKHGIGVTA